MAKNNIAGFLTDSRLHFKSRGVMAYILAYGEDHQISLQRLIDNSPEGLAAIRTATRELEKYGYIKHLRVQQAGSGRMNGILWEIYPNSYYDDKQPALITGTRTSLQAASN